jgi:DNA replication protein DnaC
MITQQTLQHLTELKLWGMREALQHQLEQPQTYDLSFEERLGLLVDYEKTYRQDKKIERLIKAAKLRHSVCIEDMDYHHRRSLKREAFSHLATGRWIKETFNLMITGPTGIGKSWIACALGHQACRLGLSVFYCRLSKLLEEMRLAHVDGSYLRLLARLTKVDLLILDDWGLERFTVEPRRDLLDIVEERHNLKSIMITSQLPLHAWHEIIGDPTIADAILDRLLSRTFKLELTGESMRKQKDN